MIQTCVKHHLFNFLQFIGKNNQEKSVDGQLNEATQVKGGGRERPGEKPKRRTATPAPGATATTLDASEEPLPPSNGARRRATTVDVSFPYLARRRQLLM